MTFRVDGVSYQRLLERAQKATSRGEGGALLSMAEWEAKCIAKARAQFATAKRMPLRGFSTPALMKQFFDLCASRPDEYRELVAMELYRTGGFDPKTKEPLTAWRTYTGSAAPDFSLERQEAA